MEEVIKRIIQIEEEAAEIEKFVDEKIKQKRLEQDQTLEKLHQVLKSKAMSKVSTLREWEMKMANEEVERQQMLAQEKIRNLTQIETEKAEEWVSQLFAEIIKE
ncbi:hypothetical protein EII17_03255 [Clostridiales bacterium COT073_COT-073]|nr:hypothetical protein EII17_03255 [Clostridiales bacterium COT073_COT-073]